LSKDYLAGKAPEDWMPLRTSDYYTERQIELLLGTRVIAVDATARTIKLENGSERKFGALLLATGAEPVHLPVPGAETSRVFYLRSFADGRAIAAAASPTSTALVIGSSFIGLEVAASLRTRNIPVHVVGPEQIPLERILGRDAGRFVQHLHEEKGVKFHLGQTVERLSGRTATLSGGDQLETDFVVVGAGVRPVTDLAKAAGLRLDNGILVNEFLETSAAGIFAAGDAARWPNPITGQPTRIEHWVVAERQGQIAARNILGQRQRFEFVPFFWSQHYDTTINYIGFSEPWDAVVVDGTFESQDCRIRYEQKGRTVAVATIFRDRESLQAEVDMEREIANATTARSARQ
jgi:NADPH-dependent 2,4-dienoyl-CoA reductase/sulfur reductase-like enzyme